MPHLFPALIAKGLGQVFANSKAGLAPSDLTIDPGEIHVVVGHSGAGKTVLADILAGVARPTSGSIHLHGQLTSLKDERDAAEKGIRYLKRDWDTHSRQLLVDALDLGPVPRKFGLVDSHALHERASAHLAMVGLADVDTKMRICDLPTGKQKLVQLAACLAKPAALLVLDDPTASLTEAESEILFTKLSQLQYAQTGVVYLTSRAQEAMEVGDKISVLRDGQLISTHSHEGLFIHQLNGEMLGREIPQTKVDIGRICGPELAIRFQSLSNGPRMIGFSVKVKRGEVVGLAGLQGGGQSEVLKAAVGLEPREEGEIYLRASASPSRISSQEQALANGLGFVQDPWGRSADPVPPASALFAKHYLRALNSNNPQKARIAACLAANCSVLLFDSPTRGLSIANRLEVHQVIHDIADEGVAIVAASTDVEELTRFCDRICVMVNGAVIRTVEKSAFDVEKIQALLKTPYLR